MKKVDYKAMNDEELKSNYILLKRNLFNLKLQHSVGQVSNPHEISTTKKNIARVLTEMTARNIDSSKINMPVEKKKVKKAAKPQAKAEKVSKETVKASAETKSEAKTETKKTTKSATAKTAEAKTTTKKESV